MDVSMFHLHLWLLYCPKSVSNHPRNTQGISLEVVTRLLDSRISATQPVTSRGELCQKLAAGPYCLGRTGCLPDRFIWFELSKPKLEVTDCRRELLSKTMSWKHGCDPEEGIGATRKPNHPARAQHFLPP